MQELHSPRVKGGRKKKVVRWYFGDKTQHRDLPFFLPCRTLLQQCPQRLRAKKLSASLVEITTLCWCLGLISWSAWGQIRLLQEDRPRLHILFIWSDLYGGCDVGRRLLSTSSVSRGTRNSLRGDKRYLLKEKGIMSTHRDTSYDVQSKYHVRCCKALGRVGSDYFETWSVSEYKWHDSFVISNPLNAKETPPRFHLNTFALFSHHFKIKCP